MKTVFIYALIDPRNNEIKYVGKTNNVKRRFYQHLTEDGKYKKVRWINKLLSLKIKPIMIELDEVLQCDEDFWKTHWISLIKSWGFELLNHTNGGTNPPIVRKFGNDNSFKIPAVSAKILEMNHARKGKTFEELYGEEKAKELKEISSKRNHSSGNGNFKGKVEQRTLNGELINTWPDSKTAAKNLNIDASGITRCITGKYKQAYGYIWVRLPK